MTKPDGLQLDRILFIGRTYFEYLRMFDLDESALGRGRVLVVFGQREQKEQVIGIQ